MRFTLNLSFFSNSGTGSKISRYCFFALREISFAACGCIPNIVVRFSSKDFLKISHIAFAFASYFILHCLRFMRFHVSVLAQANHEPLRKPPKISGFLIVYHKFRRVSAFCSSLKKILENLFRSLSTDLGFFLSMQVFRS